MTPTTPVGARLRSNSVLLRAFRLSRSIPRPATTPLPISGAPGGTAKFVIPSAARNLLFLFVLAITLFFASTASAQIQVQTPPPPPPGQNTGTPQAGGRIKLDVNLVVLHTSVLDDRGKFVDGLAQDSFRVYEDKVEQKLSIFKREDIPVSMGLVIDNSGSMRDKRPRVNEAALTLVQASNPSDEAFVVNFNDDFYLDLDKDFSNSVPELKEALERIDARGSTALYDAIIGSLDHLKKGHKEKKVLLIVTDGEDNTSRNSLEKTVKEIQKTDTVIYTIGLLSQESKKSAKNARKALVSIAQASGGVAYFPENVEDVHSICEQVAHDIRHQYTLAYYPSNTAKDGSFRSVHVDVIPPHGHGKLTARTRNGYYAPGTSSSASGK
ncbi:MAG TPA: VWA domain-containing protein [Dongiaceae bacterium]|nr:VWA domain-containing protein [Dongiaceae bacterium]